MGSGGDDVKKILFFLLIVLTWYLAGMYRFFPLLLLCMIELLVIPAGLIFCHILASHISCSFAAEKLWLESGNPGTLEIDIKNSGRLPVTHIAIYISFKYAFDKKRTKRILITSVGKDSQRETLEINAPYAGLINISIRRIRVYDWFSLFSARKKTPQTIEAAIFPPEQAMEADLPSHPDNQLDSGDNTLVSNGIEMSHELRDIHEYRPGDMARHIHWNLSARSDKTWVKEYEAYNEDTAEIFLDPSEEPFVSAEDFESFITSLSDTIFGLLQQSARVIVHWQEPGKNEPVEMQADSAEKCREILYKLYQTQHFHSKIRIWNRNYEEETYIHTN